MTTRPRRAKGTGTIRVTPEGKFRALFPFTKGTREDIDGSPFATYDAADAALDGVLRALQEAGAVQGGVTLARLGDKALAQRELDGYRSVDGEREVWELRVSTWRQAGLPASMTTRGDVRAWLAAMRNRATGKPLAAQTRRNALNVLRAVYAYGVDHELVTENPCGDVRVKDHGRTVDGSTFLTAPEADALVEVATDPGVALAIGTGMRSGELRSLLWSDVHEHHITVRFGKPGEPTKSGRTRDIPILPLARKAIDALPRTHEMVLPSVTGAFRAKGQVFERDDWKAWKKAAGIARRVRPHDLRHTCATLLLTGAWGRAWTYEEVKEMLGHSSVKVTERYARATGTLAQKAANAMIVGAEKERDAMATMMTQARDLLSRRGSDSNRRMTVLQTEQIARVFPVETSIPLLARSFVEAVAAGDPFALLRGLELADAAWPEGAAATAEVAS